MSLEPAIPLGSFDPVSLHDAPVFKRIAPGGAIETIGKSATPELLQEDPLHRPELGFVLAESECVVDAGERLRPVAAQGGEPGDFDVRFLLVREPPRAAPEEILRTLQVAKMPLDKREIVFRRGIKGARVVLRGAGDRLFEIRFRVRIRAVLRKPYAHCDIRLGVAGIDFKRSSVVRLRVDETVVELVETQADFISEFGGDIFLRRLGIFHLRR